MYSLWSILVVADLVYFFKTRQKIYRFIFSLIKEKVLEFLQAQPWYEKPRPNRTKNYSHGMILLIAFAPAMLHKATSLLIFSTSIVADKALFLKTLAFRSFQISQDTSTAREAKAFLEGPLL
jgi:hypothetical protein